MVLENSWLGGFISLTSLPRDTRYSQIFPDLSKQLKAGGKNYSNHEVHAENPMAILVVEGVCDKNQPIQMIFVEQIQSSELRAAQRESEYADS